MSEFVEDMRRYEEKATPQDRQSLTQEGQRLHKLISELDMMIDDLSTRAESILLPSRPTSVEDERIRVVTPEELSPLRGEVRILAGRLEVLIVRFRHVLNRIDL